MNIGSIWISIKAENAKQSEKDILAVESAFSRTAKSMISKIPSIEYFLKKWGVALGAVSLAAGGLYMLIKAGPVAYAYWEEFGILLGAVSDTIVTALSPAIDVVLDVLWKLEEWFAGLPEPVQAAIGILAIVGASILALSLVVGAASTGFGILVAVLAPVIAAIAGLAVPILAAMALIAFFYIAWSKGWLDIKEIAVSVILIIAGFLMGGPIGVAIAFLLVLIYTAWKNNWFGIRDITDKVVKWISDQIGGFAGWIVEKWTAIRDFIGGVWEAISKTATQWWDSLIKVFDDTVTKIKNIWGGLIEWVKKNPIVQTISAVYKSASSTISGRQVGGPVSGSTPYMVGERGPELFIPGSGGSISPNSQLSSGGQPLNINLKVELDGRQIWQSVRQYSSAEIRRLGGY